MFLGVCGTDVTINQLENFVYQPYVCFLNYIRRIFSR
jgi:hypothetical protein